LWEPDESFGEEQLQKNNEKNKEKGVFGWHDIIFYLAEL
jgi:hypothetical protein